MTVSVGASTAVAAGNGGSQPQGMRKTSNRPIDTTGWSAAERTTTGRAERARSVSEKRRPQGGDTSAPIPIKIAQR